MTFAEKFTEKGQYYASKIQQNKYMQAISNGLMSLLPIMIIGAFSTLLSSMQIEVYQSMIAPFRDIIALPAQFTTNALAIYAAFSIALYCIIADATTLGVWHSWRSSRFWYYSANNDGT